MSEVHNNGYMSGVTNIWVVFKATKTSGYLEDCVVLEAEERKCIRKMLVTVQVNQALGFEH